MEMNMKKLISIAVAASMMLIGTTAFAQASIGAGYINETNKAKLGDTNRNLGSMNGFYAGIGYDINEGVGFGINTGVYYSYLTGQLLSLVDIVEHAINIPVKPGFSATLGNGLKGFVNAGPTFVCGLSSQIKPLGVAIDNYDHEFLGRFDIMVGGTIGVEINDMFRVNASYDFGVLDQFGESANGLLEHIGLKNGGSGNSLNLNRSRITIGAALLF